MCGWWIREHVDCQSRHFGNSEVSTSIYHVASFPSSPIANLPKRKPDEVTS
jgi:hypothetical protein